MQGDGNLVCRDLNGGVLWKSDTRRNNGASVLVTDAGRVIIYLNRMEVWSVGQRPPTPAPTAFPTFAAPTPSPVNGNPTSALNAQATNARVSSRSTTSALGSSASIVLESNESLLEGQFVYSPNGRYGVGLRNDGAFVLETSSGTTLWSADIPNEHSGEMSRRIYMQDDGNLVIRKEDRTLIWDSDTYRNHGAYLLLSNNGRATIERNGDELWFARGASTTFAPVVSPTTPSPVATPPTNSPLTSTPVQTMATGTPNYDATIVFESSNFIDLGQFVSSPKGDYSVGLREDGELVLVETSSGSTLWSAGVVERHGSGRGYRCFLQPDGNVIIRDRSGTALWNSKTSRNYGSYMVVDDGGQVAILQGGTPIWLQGIPRGTYQTPSSTQDLQYPIRGMFYYPWYPETWTVNGEIARFEPQLGFYSSGDPSVIEEHVDMMEYAYTDLSIASWWGPDTNLDKARIRLLMDKTIEMGSNIKWTIYHEEEFRENASAQQIKQDLDYLKEWFAWHPAWAHIDGRPVVFVYNEVGCGVANRWMEASNSEWYVVLKVFKGFQHCPVQADSWHQYGPLEPVVQVPGHSFGVSPGFWRADIENPGLDRVSESDFCDNVNLMVQSNDPWQLITTFNEAGEGTMVEASPHWPSSSGYGFYLDCLHAYH